MFLVNIIVVQVYYFDLKESFVAAHPETCLDTLGPHWDLDVGAAAADSGLTFGSQTISSGS